MSHIFGSTLDQYKTAENMYFSGQQPQSHTKGKNETPHIWEVTFDIYPFICELPIFYFFFYIFFTTARF